MWVGDEKPPRGSNSQDDGRRDAWTAVHRSLDTILRYDILANPICRQVAPTDPRCSCSKSRGRSGVKTQLDGLDQLRQLVSLLLGKLGVFVERQSCTSATVAFGLSARLTLSQRGELAVSFWSYTKNSHSRSSLRIRATRPARLPCVCTSHGPSHQHGPVPHQSNIMQLTLIPSSEMKPLSKPCRFLLITRISSRTFLTSLMFFRSGR